MNASDTAPANKASTAAVGMVKELRPQIQALVAELGGSPGQIIEPKQAILARPPAPKEILALIDVSRLKPEAMPEQVDRMCADAVQYGFASVCVNPIYIARVVERVRGSAVAPSAVVGFPFGATLPQVKAFEAGQVIQAGCREIDMVLPIGELKVGNYHSVAEDLLAVVCVCHPEGVLVKVIFETAYLDLRQKVAACLIAMETGADFVKTSTGFALVGATVEDVALMRSLVGGRLGVKAAGGIRTLADCQAIVAAGATRLATSSDVAIVREVLGKK